MLHLLSSQAVSATLYRLADWLRPPVAQSAQEPASIRKSANIVVFPVARSASTPTGHQRTQRDLSRRRPLRIIRVLDAEPLRSGAGRIVMSGCIADVCAELDRLAQKESALA